MVVLFYFDGGVIINLIEDFVDKISNAANFLTDIGLDVIIDVLNFFSSMLSLRIFVMSPFMLSD